MKKSLLCSTALLVSTLGLWAGELNLRGTTDKEAALYQAGEKITFFVQLLDDSTPVAGKKLRWKRTGDDGKEESGEAVSSAAEPLKLTTSLNQPGFVRIQVSAFDENDQPLMSKIDAGNNKPVEFSGGAGVEVAKLESVEEPADFDAFWAKQKARLAQVPLKFTLAKVESQNPEFDVFDVKVDCAGGKPVSGYLSKPKNAAPKSLIAQFGLMGYGWDPAKPHCAQGVVFFNINAHGMENGKEPAYYEALKDGALKGYGFKNDENSNPETTYFNGMFLRLIRAMEFLKTQPEWNGKELQVMGGSQGGFQAIAAASLDQSVSECTVFIPWCCDLGGVTKGRLGGWRPDYVAALDYYDPVNMAKRIHCKTSIIAGLGDYTCPPSGICVLYNHLKGPKRLEFVQGGIHSYMPKGAQKTILEENQK